MKRFKECNIIEKAWRYRWYLLLPFQWFWRNYVNGITIGIDEEDDNGNLVHTEKFYIPTGRELWELLKGNAQFKMKLYYTQEEVEKMFNEYKNRQ